MSFGEKIKQERLRRGLTQEQLAEKVGIKQPVIAQYERGSKHPTIPTARTIAEALDCELVELVSD